MKKLTCSVCSKSKWSTAERFAQLSEAEKSAYICRDCRRAMKERGAPAAKIPIETVLQTKVNIVEDPTTVYPSAVYAGTAPKSVEVAIPEVNQDEDF